MQFDSITVVQNIRIKLLSWSDQNVGTYFKQRKVNGFFINKCIIEMLQVSWKVQLITVSL